MALEGYVSATSVFQGGDISFHVSDDAAGIVRIEIFEVRANRRAPLLLTSAPAGRYVIPDRAYELGCGWPPFYSFTVPAGWPSGLYRVRLSNCETPAATTDIFFVVKALHPASGILLQFAATTYQAYNTWGGKNLYPSESPCRSRKVSFHRPGGIDYVREIAFLMWAQQNEVLVECCTSIDLHEAPSFLNQYQLFVSVGHDEYWSKEMRDNLEQFIGNGGNVAFFSGNVCWWQVRFEDNNRTMICYKSALEDPLAGVDNSRVTVNWYSSPVNRPENYLTGVSFRNGAGLWQPCNSSMRTKSFSVCHPEHWVFEGTGLNKNDLVGSGENIVGYETDAADYYMDPGGNIRLSGRDGTPPSFVVLAVADLSDWGPCGKAGRATMGIYRRTGTVFTAATTDWVSGLFRPASAVRRITHNVIHRLKQSFPGSRWEVIGDAAHISAMCAGNDKLFAATRNNMLYCREPIAQNISWEVIGRARDIMAIAVGADPKSKLGQVLYAATRNGQLLRRDIVKQDVPWEVISEAPDVIGLAAINNYLFAATAQADLCRRTADQHQLWEQVGHLDNLVTITALGNELFAVTNNWKLWWCNEPTLENGPGGLGWKCLGEVPQGIVGLAAWSGKLFVATSADLLLWRDAVPC